MFVEPYSECTVRISGICQEEDCSTALLVWDKINIFVNSRKWDCDYLSHRRLNVFWKLEVDLAVLNRIEHDQR